MQQSTSKKSAIRKAATKLLWKEKKSKSETYDILVQEFLDQEKVVDVLSHLPDLKSKNQYKIHENILIGFFVALFAYFIESNTIGSVIMFGILLYSLITHRIEVYIYLAVYAFLMSAIGLFILFYTEATIELSEILFIAVPIAVGAYTIWLEKKLCPKPQVSKKSYLSSKGQKRFKIEVAFPN